MAAYLTDADGAFKGTLWIAGGGQSKYYRHLRGWKKLARGVVDGSTGASVKSGKYLTTSAELT